MRLLALLFVCMLASAASAERRVALVIGNAAYEIAPALANPVNDAKAIGAALDRLGFEVTLATDVGIDAMREAVREFGVSAEGADLALFYYAGHGIQVAGRNFLIPTDVALEREGDVDFRTVSLDLVLNQIDRAGADAVILLDACRDNPFESALSRAMGPSRSAALLGRGLAPVEARSAALIALATDPGAVAFDGAGRHSPFTGALLSHIEEPGLELNAVMTRVRADVFRDTGERQRPWTTTSLTRQVVLTGPAEGEIDPADVAAWRDAVSADTGPAYEAYLEAFPVGAFADIAKDRRAAASSAPGPADLAAWRTAVTIDTAAAYGEYLAGFPDGAFADLARSRQAAAAALPDPADVTAWREAVNEDTEAAYDAYLLAFPEGAFADIALERRSVARAAADPDDIAAWRTAVEFDTAESYGAYLEAYPDGLFADLAEAQRLAALGDDAAGTPSRPILRLLDPEPDIAPTEPVLEETAVEPAPLCPACPRLVTVPGGATVLGIDGGPEAEGPATPQTIAPFEVAATEITVGAFRQYVSETGADTPRGCHVWTDAGRVVFDRSAYWGAPGYPVMDESPAACLNADDAEAFAVWLSEQVPGAAFRLPTEGEFEFALRAGQAGPFPWEGGPDEACAHVNGADSDSRFRWRNQDCADPYPDIAPAGATAANAFGIHDLSGNLWEWTADCFNATHAGAPQDGSARLTGICASRVLRGGSWDDPVDNLRITYRTGIPKDRRQGNVGFRLVLEPEG
ncbi:MAG: SUMF1/EgtB/PvdO family nonheme iron enzyme [Pseudomonadota bacterium]